MSKTLKELKESMDLEESFIVFGDTGDSWTKLGSFKTHDEAKDTAKKYRTEDELEHQSVIVFDVRKDKVVFRNNRIR